MVGLGTLINAAGILVAGSLGLFLARGLSEKIKENIIRIQGLAVMVLGLSGVLSSLGQGFMDELVLILSLVLGGLLGYFLDLEGKLDGLAQALEKRFARDDDNFTQGFLIASMTMCVGAMAIMGALNDALYGDISILLSKTTLDSFLAFAMAGYYGIGVLFSVLPLLVWQGSITLMASFLAPYLTEAVLHNISMVGSVLILAIGVNLVFDEDLPLVNMLGALLVAVVFGLFV